jgi:hypothetical protein
MLQIKFVSGDKLTYLASTVAIAISKEFDNSDINILSSFFSAIGDNLGIIASRNEAILEILAKSDNSKDSGKTDNSNNSKVSGNSNGSKDSDSSNNPTKTT